MKKILLNKPPLVSNVLLDPSRTTFGQQGFNLIKCGGEHVVNIAYTFNNIMKEGPRIENKEVITLGFFRWEDFRFKSLVPFNVLVEHSRKLEHLAPVGAEILEQLVFDLLDPNFDWPDFLPKNKKFMIVCTDSSNPRHVAMMDFYPDGDGKYEEPTIWLESDLSYNKNKDTFYLFKLI